mmetsp:Transcript_1686/g.2756  ORF Transcript_1686/g.2756 Transcript_1686/m.2756 type:complete len:160 (+) Transcript_1686:917-1396(+)
MAAAVFEAGTGEAELCAMLWRVRGVRDEVRDGKANGEPREGMGQWEVWEVMARGAASVAEGARLELAKGLKVPRSIVRRCDGSDETCLCTSLHCDSAVGAARSRGSKRFSCLLAISSIVATSDASSFLDGCCAADFWDAAAGFATHCFTSFTAAAPGVT